MPAKMKKKMRGNVIGTTKPNTAVTRFITCSIILLSIKGTLLLSIFP
jgi:hypothetical protein